MMQLKSLEIYKSAFGSYDIRSIYQDVLDAPFAYILGKAIAAYMQSLYGTSASQLLIGGDTRPCNNELISYFIAGLRDGHYTTILVADFVPRVAYESGKELRFGAASSSVMYYIGRGECELGVVFSASHNPKEYAGMKFFDKEGAFLDPAMLFEWFSKEYARTQTIPQNVTVEVERSGLVERKKGQLFDFLSKKYETLNKYHQFAVDFSNGAGVSVERDFLEDVLVAKNHRVEFLNDVADGTFPNHASDTVKEQYYDQLRGAIANGSLEFGVMFDGDVDRLGIVTPSGRVMRGDILLAVIAKQVFASFESTSGFEKSVVYDVMCTRMIQEKATELGGTAIINRMGRKFINERMKETKAIVGGELSGHYMYGELGGCELVLLSLYYVIKESENFSSFDAMLDAYEKYPKSPSLSFEVSDKEAVLDAVFQEFVDYKPLRLDGVNVYADQFFVTVRKSNTEPIIRVVVEANNQDLLDDVMARVNGVLAPYVTGTGGH